MFLYTCMDADRRIKNCKDPLDTVRITKITRDKNFIFLQTPSKFCMNMKKSHRSNHVYYVVNMDKKVLYQRCYDENCKKYEGLHHKLSLPILDKFKDVPYVDFVTDDIYSAFAIDRGTPRNV